MTNEAHELLSFEATAQLKPFGGSLQCSPRPSIAALGMRERAGGKDEKGMRVKGIVDRKRKGMGKRKRRKRKIRKDGEKGQWKEERGKGRKKWLCSSFRTWL